MTNNLLQELTTLISNSEVYKSPDGILKNKLIEDGFKNDSTLIKLLLSNSNLKTHFFIELDQGVLVFNSLKFQQFLSLKDFLPDSYTSFKNKIGLTDDGDYLTQNKNVVLDFPYKDCVLEGGQSKDDAKRKEIFWNETLAPDEIDVLLEPKILTNAKKYTTKKTIPLVKGSSESLGVIFNRNSDGTITDNLIIKGNNLIALHSLKKEFKGKVKLIYIDPPYNTGSDSFGYNDKFNHSTWLVFMKNRLEVAKDLLREDGVIFVQCDDNEQAYLKVLMDEVFGRENFVSNIIHNNKYTISNDSKWTSKQCEFIIIFCRLKNRFNFNLLSRTQEMDDSYKNPDNDKRGAWKSTPINAKSGSETGRYELTFKNGIKWTAPNGRFPRYSKSKLSELDIDDRIYFGRDGNAIPSTKTFLSEVKNGKGVGTFWSYSETGSSHQANEELAELFGKGFFSNPKPEKLLQRIIEISTQPNDIVLDYHLGSGTTTAVAHKMGRQYIGVEQMDYIETISVERMKKVIDGEQGGISKAVNWQGGGEFVYLELKQHNQNFVERIQKAQNQTEIKSIWKDIQKTGFLSYKVDLKLVDQNAKGFEGLSLEDGQKFLMEVLDKNMLYINLSDLDNADYPVSEEDKLVNKSFYKGKK